MREGAGVCCDACMRQCVSANTGHTAVFNMLALAAGSHMLIVVSYNHSKHGD